MRKISERGREAMRENMRKAHAAAMAKFDLTDPGYVAKFMARSKVTDKGCWHFTGPVHPKGYAQISYRGKQWRIHRFSYHVHKGPIPAGLMICHQCDNPSCWNPEHLYAGTMSENALDSAERLRHANAKKTHCRHGHEFTPENTLYTTVSDRPHLQRRQCRICNVIRARLDVESGRAAARTRKSKAKKRLQQVSEGHDTSRRSRHR